MNFAHGMFLLEEAREEVIFADSTFPLRPFHKQRESFSSWKEHCGFNLLALEVTSVKTHVSTWSGITLKMNSSVGRVGSWI